ncbi:hypothetical protein ACIRON_28930 [Nocardioides sp. NPDC101246]|uniref:hypothetical protein n=1 Tax=Nocardioides sp. NPDC101246 TaxID=3364336 RepID=UPI003800A4CF
MTARAEALSCWQRLQGEYGRYLETIRILQAQKGVGFLKVQEDLRRYLCLRCAGFLEQVVFLVLDGYLTQKTSGPTRDFARSYFNQAPNLNVDAFTRLIARFGSNHVAELEVFLTTPRRDTLGDLLGIRNDVAHGRVFNGQRLAPERYLILCEEIYDWLIDTFLGESVEVLDGSGRSVVAYERTS